VVRSTKKRTQTPHARAAVKGEDDKETLAGGLRWLHETQYDVDGLRSKERTVQCWTQIEKFFRAATQMTELTLTQLDEYAKARLKEGAARQTVNNELSALRRGLRLAVEKAVARYDAAQDRAAEGAERAAGLLRDGDFAAILLELPAIFQAVIRFLRLTGWRATEALTLTWDEIDGEGETTRAMFDRYNIMDEADLASAVAKRFSPANGTVTAQKRASRQGAAA